jgi:protocatechuate 3,4-dioxygenase beta subunit
MAVAVSALTPAVSPGQELAPTGTVTGVVVNGLGEPMRAVEVWCVRSPDSGRRLAKGLTDGEGFFVLSKIPVATNYVRVHSTAPGLSQESAYASIQPGNLHDQVRIRLWDAAPVRGRVVDAAGKPIEGVRVSASNDGARVFGFGAQSETTTDEDGRFTMSKVPLGELQVRAWAEGFLVEQEDLWHAGDREGIVLTLKKGPGVTLDIRVDGIPKDVTGTVRILPYGRGGYRFLPAPLNGDIDPEGRYSVAGLPDLEYLVSVSLPDHSLQPREQRTKPGEVRHELHFTTVADATNVIRGVLVDGNKKPLAGERLECRAANGGRRADAVTDARGRFGLSSPLAPGAKAVIYLVNSRYVTAQPAKGGPFDTRDLHWHEFEIDPKSELEIVAQPRSVVEGVLKDEKGRLLPMQRVTLQHAKAGRTPNWLAFQYGTTDREGRFRFEKLRPPEDQIRVTFGQESIGQSTEPFLVGVGESRTGIELVVTSPGATSLSGVVRDHDGNPVPGARVWLRDFDLQAGKQASGSVIEVLAGRDGRYRFDVVPGGHWVQVFLEKDREAIRTEPFEIQAGSSMRKDLEVEPPRDG